MARPAAVRHLGCGKFLTLGDGVLGITFASHQPTSTTLQCCMTCNGANCLGTLFRHPGVPVRNFHEFFSSLLFGTFRTTACTVPRRSDTADESLVGTTLPGSVLPVSTAGFEPAAQVRLIIRNILESVIRQEW